jgi:hypothetical protein
MSLMNTVKLCHLCEMGQRQPGMTRFETERSTLLVRFALKIILVFRGVNSHWEKRLACATIKMSMLDPRPHPYFSRRLSLSGIRLCARPLGRLEIS